MLNHIFFSIAMVSLFIGYGIHHNSYKVDNHRAYQFLENISMWMGIIFILNAICWIGYLVFIIIK
jgi:hypothetical protein